MGWFLSEAAITLRSQINKRYPRRDVASDGSVGDTSHQARPSDHNPDWTAGGVVRAIDVDANLQRGDPAEMDKLAGQLIRYARLHRDRGRLKYVIWNGAIASGTDPDRFWTWRPYLGTDPHTGHMHVSFTDAGDHRGGKFDLPVFTEPHRRRVLRRTINSLTHRITALRKKRRAARKQLAHMGD